MIFNNQKDIIEFVTNRHKDLGKDLIVVKDLAKSFRLGEAEEHALRGVSLKICASDFVIVYGPSGSGKSTLLNMIIGLEPPTEGTIAVDGNRIDLLPENERSLLRREYFGVVYQQPRWIKSLSILDNISIPLLVAGSTKQEARYKAAEALRDVAVSEFANRKPTEISGGQQQRVSLARALVLDPPILVLDEPTGNLDSQNANFVIDLLRRLNKEKGTTIIMVTHNLDYLPLANNQIAIYDGTVKSQKHTHHGKNS